MDSRSRGVRTADVDAFYMALTQLLRNFQFRDRDRQTICGITVTQCYALEFVVREGRLTILDVGNRLALNKSNASRVVEALEGVGAVSRTADPTNHRIRWIEPTAYGRQLHAEITAGLKREYTNILAPLSPSFIRKVTHLLEVLADRTRPARTCSPPDVQRGSAGSAVAVARRNASSRSVRVLSRSRHHRSRIRPSSNR